MRTTITLAALLLLGPGAVADAQGPAPMPEHKRLAYFAGTWNFSGTAKESPVGPGGPVSFKETCELLDGGFAVVCRSEGKGPTGPTKAISIMTYDVDKKAYTYTSAESNSPVLNAVGQTQGPTWNWRSEMGTGAQKVIGRVTVKEGGPKAYDFLMEMSMDGKKFMPIIEGKATR